MAVIKFMGGFYMILALIMAYYYFKRPRNDEDAADTGQRR